MATSKREPQKPTVRKAAPKEKPDPILELQTQFEEMEENYGEVSRENAYLKKQLAKEKDNYSEISKKVDALTDKFDNVNRDTRGWLNRGNKWAFAAVPVIILGAWLLWTHFVTIPKRERQAVEAYQTNNAAAADSSVKESKENLDKVLNETAPPKAAGRVKKK
jgi:hypothetical protein